MFYQIDRGRELNKNTYFIFQFSPSPTPFLLKKTDFENNFCIQGWIISFNLQGVGGDKKLVGLSKNVYIPFLDWGWDSDNPLFRVFSVPDDQILPPQIYWYKGPFQLKIWPFKVCIEWAYNIIQSLISRSFPAPVGQRFGAMLVCFYSVSFWLQKNHF